MSNGPGGREGGRETRSARFPPAWVPSAGPSCQSPPPHPSAAPQSRARAPGRLEPRPPGSLARPPSCRWPRPPGSPAPRRAASRTGGR